MDATDDTAPAGERAGDFERYALVAMLTLVVLCLLLVDGLRHRPEAAALPREQDLLRVEIGGAVVPLPDPARAPQPPPRRVSETPPANPPVVVPAPADAPRTVVPSPPPERVYVVQESDTLSDIAARELGSGSRAMEIARLNDLADPDVISAGQELRLPTE